MVSAAAGAGVRVCCVTCLIVSNVQKGAIGHTPRLRAQARLCAACQQPCHPPTCPHAARTQRPAEPPTSLSVGPPAAGYLPLVWAGTLAYYLDNAFEEAGLILPVGYCFLPRLMLVLSSRQAVILAGREGRSLLPSLVARREGSACRRTPRKPGRVTISQCAQQAPLCAPHLPYTPAALAHLPPAALACRLPQVAAATFGFDAPWLPTFAVDPVVTEFLQASVPAPPLHP